MRRETWRPSVEAPTAIGSGRPRAPLAIVAGVVSRSSVYRVASSQQSTEPIRRRGGAEAPPSSLVVCYARAPPRVRGLCAGTAAARLLHPRLRD